MTTEASMTDSPGNGYNRIIDSLWDHSQRHPCEHAGCPHSVEYDDEPWCFTHSPDSGSAVSGYSYKAKHGSIS